MSAINRTYQSATDTAGTGLFAATDIEAGEAVLRLSVEETYSVLGDTSKACDNCFLLQEAPEDEGEACQTLAWKHHHKHECKVYKSLQDVVLPDPVLRLIMRILFRRKRNVLPDAKWEAIIRTQHHLDDFKAQTQPDGKTTWEIMQLKARAIREYSGSNEDIDTIASIMCRIATNSHTLFSPMKRPLGICFAPSASFFNHSCSPNAAITFSGPILSIRSLVPIAKSSEIFITYINTANPPIFRQAELKCSYFFTCACVECSASPPRTLGRVDPSRELLATMKIEQLGELESDAEELMGEARRAAYSEDQPMLRIETLKKAMNMFQSITDYPLYRLPYATIRGELADVFMERQLYVSAFIQSLIVYFDIDPMLYLQKIDATRVVHIWSLMRLAAKLAVMASSGNGEYRDFGERYELDWRIVVVGLYVEIQENVKGSHGAESRFAERVRKEAIRLQNVPISSRLDVNPTWNGEPPSMEEVQREWLTLRRIAKDGLEGHIG